MIYECHGHIILDGTSYVGAVERHKNGVNESFIRQNLRICKEYGIKFYRDGGDKHGATILAKKIACEFAIDYRTPAYIIHKKGYYGGMFGRAFVSIPEYRALVEEAKRLGADFIKTTVSGMLDFKSGGRVTGPSMAREEISEMITIAHGEGFAVMIHANGSDNIKRAVESGADSIEHGYYMDIDALRMMAQTGAVWVPTSVTVANLIGSGKYCDNMLRQIDDGHKEAMQKAAGLGVPIACGSDAGAAKVLQGTGTLDELRALTSLGIDPAPGDRRIEEVFKRGC